MCAVWLLYKNRIDGELKRVTPRRDRVVLGGKGGRFRPFAPIQLLKKIIFLFFLHFCLLNIYCAVSLFFSS